MCFLLIQEIVCNKEIAIHCVSIWSHDQSDALISVIRVTKYFAPIPNLEIHMNLFWSRKAENSPKWRKTRQIKLEMAQFIY